MKKILLTGGAGFIGSHLADRLLNDGHHVTCVDNLCSGQENNIHHLKDHPDFEFIKKDLLQPGFIDSLVDQSYNYIFHLASPASPVFYKALAVETLLVNSLATIKLLKLAKVMQARFLFTSTSEMYGDPLEHPQKEDYRGNVNPVGPKAHYKEAKRFGETATITFAREYGVDVRIVRIFNTYGPRNRPNDGRVIPNFINQTLNDQPLTVYGDGSQTRSYCYVTDLVDGLVKVMFSQNAQSEVINLGNPDEYTILQTAEIIRDAINPSIKIRFMPLPSEDPLRRKPDITKAKKILNWEPNIDFKQGLEKTIEYFTNRSPD